MTKQNDGGPAFPSYEWLDPVHGKPGWAPVLGMSLRDYFAGQAITGIISIGTVVSRGNDCPNIADMAYRIADAMLEARKQ